MFSAIEGDDETNVRLPNSLLYVAVKGLQISDFRFLISVQLITLLLYLTKFISKTLRKGRLFYRCQAKCYFHKKQNKKEQVEPFKFSQSKGIFLKTMQVIYMWIEIYQATNFASYLEVILFKRLSNAGKLIRRKNLDVK